jgi:hypothetical protein
MPHRFVRRRVIQILMPVLTCGHGLSNQNCPSSDIASKRMIFMNERHSCGRSNSTGRSWTKRKRQNTQMSSGDVCGVTRKKRLKRRAGSKCLGILFQTSWEVEKCLSGEEWHMCHRASRLVWSCKHSDRDWRKRSRLASRCTSGLQADVQLTAKNLPRLDEDERLGPVIDHLASSFLSGIAESNYQPEGETAGSVVTAEMVDDVARKHFPACMRNLYERLKRDHHLKHFGRLQLGLFLKVGVGILSALIVRESGCRWKKR